MKKPKDSWQQIAEAALALLKRTDAWPVTLEQNLIRRARALRRASKAKGRKAPEPSAEKGGEV